MLAVFEVGLVPNLVLVAGSAGPEGSFLEASLDAPPPPALLGTWSYTRVAC